MQEHGRVCEWTKIAAAIQLHNGRACLPWSICAMQIGVFRVVVGHLTVAEPSLIGFLGYRSIDLLYGITSHQRQTAGIYGGMGSSTASLHWTATSRCWIVR